MKIVLLFVLCVSVTLVFSERTIVEKDNTFSVPEVWNRVSDAPGNHRIPVILAIKQRNLDELERIFWEVSDPRHENYGNHLSLAQITELVAPSEESIETVTKWLSSHGIKVDSIASTRDFVHFEANVETLSKMFDSKFYLFQHAENEKKLVVKTTNDYTVPSEIAEVLDYATGITQFPVEHAAQYASSQDIIPVGPSQLRERYNVTTTGTGRTSQSVAEFQGQYFSPSDLVTFFDKFVSNSGNDTVTQIEGTNDGSDPGTEASLDIQYIMGVAPNVPTWFWSNPGLDFWSDLTKWVSQISSTPNSPPVHSISYGSQSFLQQPSSSQRSRLNTEFQKLGARGMSIIFASGDSGVGCELCVLFEASFPATSPYVTAVGATRFIGSSVGPEAAVEAFKSGGGFAKHFDRPSYQNDAVNHYFEVEKDLPLSFYYRKEGRAIPDVAALGIGFQVVVRGGIQSIGGTSASAPTFSAVVSLLNEVRLAKGSPLMGFLNPWIYQTDAANANAFYDVTEGSNPHSCCLKGFKCAQGWDPVTGVGTPNFAVLKTMV